MWLRSLELVLRRMWKSLKLWARKAPECRKWNVKNRSDRLDVRPDLNKTWLSRPDLGGFSRGDSLSN